MCHLLTHIWGGGADRLFKCALGVAGRWSPVQKQQPIGLYLKLSASASKTGGCSRGALCWSQSPVHSWDVADVEPMGTATDFPSRSLLRMRQSDSERQRVFSVLAQVDSSHRNNAPLKHSTNNAPHVSSDI